MLFCVVDVVFCGTLVTCHFNEELKIESSSGEVHWEVKEGAGEGFVPDARRTPIE